MDIPFSQVVLELIGVLFQEIVHSLIALTAKLRIIWKTVITHAADNTVFSLLQQ